jgi:hypothetical protein
MTSCRNPSAVSCQCLVGSLVSWLVGWAVGGEEAEDASGHPCGDVREGAWASRSHVHRARRRRSNVDEEDRWSTG